MLIRKYLLLDMDGVLVDFVKGALEIHNNLTTTEELYAGKHGGYDIVPLFNMTAPAFWKPMDEEFWAKLDWMPDGEEILKLCEETFGRENIVICTKPSPNYGCEAGKRRWVERHLPKHYKDNIEFSAKKWMKAGWSLGLVDDDDNNNKLFTSAGGKAFPVPRIWNQWYHLRNMVLPHLRAAFQQYKEAA